MTDPELARINVSPLRRWVGLAALSIVGVVFAWAFVNDEQALFLVVAVGCALLLMMSWKATASTLVLTRDGIFDSERGEIVSLDEIQTLVTGHFAMRPSNGFSLRMKTPVAARWFPGLWWSFGRRVGIGGLASGRQTKAFAEALSIILAERNIR